MDSSSHPKILLELGSLGHILVTDLLFNVQGNNFQVPGEVCQEPPYDFLFTFQFSPPGREYGRGNRW